MTFNIEEELKKLPAQPGVYIMHDATDQIIYVGKAISLTNRVHQYFQSSRNKTAKIQKMVSKIAWFEYIVTDSELEALVLECNLIKEHQPRYNTMLKDDKAYPYIKVTVTEDFPRVLFARTMKKDKNITTDSVEKIWYSPANDGYCGGINHQHYNPTRYHALNLHSFFQKGTVEFRLFNSTLHAGKIKAYVQFCLALSAWSIESDDKVVFRTMNGYTAKKKVTLMYNILTNRLGLYGDEFKTCRLHMMKQLRENANAEHAA